MPFLTLISASQLVKSLDNPKLVILDCRFNLSDPQWGFKDYQLGHIPGSFYAHLEQDLSGRITPQTGRHPLPEPGAFLNKLKEWGIMPPVQIVVYDTAGGTFAARLWWMLKLYGLRRVALLNGGFQAWVNKGFPVKTGVELGVPAPEKLSFQPDAKMIVEAAEVERIRRDPAYRLIDARSPERYRGEMEPIDPVAGHIPGAVNRFTGENLLANGLFKKPELLKSEFQMLLGGISPRNAVVYCGSGVTSCHHLVAMEHAGLPGGRLYVGSWSEWIRDPKRERFPLA